MKKYIAKSYIGGYNAGDEVPEEKALIWKQMYKSWPIDVVDVPDKAIPEVQKQIVQEAVKEVIPDKAVVPKIETHIPHPQAFPEKNRGLTLKKKLK